jgi:hypothetical protein
MHDHDFNTVTFICWIGLLPLHVHQRYGISPGSVFELVLQCMRCFVLSIVTTSSLDYSDKEAHLARARAGECKKSWTGPPRKACGIYTVIPYQTLTGFSPAGYAETVTAVIITKLLCRRFVNIYKHLL